MILQRIKIITEDVGFEPGTSGVLLMSPLLLIIGNMKALHVRIRNIGKFKGHFLNYEYFVRYRYLPYLKET